nr:response regulator transcription factor [Saprospiraceae bacterium]
MKRIKVVLADEQNLLIDGLKHLLRDCNGTYEYEIRKCIDNGEDLLGAAREEEFDLVIMDIKLPIIDGIEIIHRIKEQKPQSRILILTSYNSNKFVKSAFKQGADGYILKNSTTDDLKNAIEEVLAGVAHMGNGVGVSPGKNGVKKKNESAVWVIEDNFLIKNYLTRRELEILSQIAHEKDNKEIAQKLYISDQTVSVHRKNIMKKLKAHDNGQLKAIALHHGLTQY